MSSKNSFDLKKGKDRTEYLKFLREYRFVDDDEWSEDKNDVEEQEVRKRRFTTTSYDFTSDTSDSADDDECSTAEEQVDENMTNSEQVPTKPKVAVMSEKEEIDHLMFVLKENANNKIQLALEWARPFETNKGSDYNSRQIAALVFLYESTKPKFSWEIGETLCNMDTAENNMLISWLNDTYVFNKQDVYDWFKTWAKCEAPLGLYIAYGMNNRYKIMQEAAVNGDNDLLEWLLSTNVEVDFRNSSRCTALHMAAAVGHVATVKFLLEHGASKFVLDSELRTPFELAFDSEHFDICDILYQTNIKSIISETMFLSIVQEGNLRKMQYLLRKTYWSSVWNALLITVGNGYPQILEMLLSYCSELHFAPSKFNEAVLTKAFIKGDKTIFEKLLAAGFKMEDSLTTTKRDAFFNWFLNKPIIDTVD